jgi:hypothetical protein
VVRGAIPDFSVVAGVPGKVVRTWTGDAWDPPLAGDHASQPPDGWFEA